MDEKEMNFIKTSDEETAEKLRNLGFIPVSIENGVHTFINCKALSYSDNVDTHELVYSNTYYG